MSGLVCAGRGYSRPLQPWWQAAGVAPTHVYQASGAASYAASKVNLANPGTNNLSDGSTAPTWDAVNGWTFGSAGYLNTGWVPSSTNCTIIVRCWGGNLAAAATAIGSYTANNYAQSIRPCGPGGQVYQNAATAQNGLDASCGIFGMAGQAVYVQEQRAFGTGGGSGPTTYPLYIGALNNAGTPSNFFMGSVQAVWIHNSIALNDNQMRALMNAMHTLTPSDGYQQGLRQLHMTRQLGAFFSWSMPTFQGNQLATQNVNINSYWTPTGLNTDQWITSLPAGTAYAFMTAKHPDGFALWPTSAYVPGYSPYSIAQSTWYTSNSNPDVFGKFVASCNKYGVMPGVYFSMPDRTYEARSGTTMATGTAAYIAFIKQQLSELLTNYGPIGYIFLDVWTWLTGGYANCPYEVIYSYIKNIQPNCLIIVNEDYNPSTYSQIMEWEVPIMGLVNPTNFRLAECIDTIGTNNWFWSASETMKSASAMNANIAAALARNSNYVLGVGPNTAGVVPSDQTAILSQIVI